MLDEGCSIFYNLQYDEELIHLRISGKMKTQAERLIVLKLLQNKDLNWFRQKIKIKKDKSLIKENATAN